MARKRRKVENSPRLKFEYLLSYGARRRLLIQEQVAQLHKSFMDGIEHDEMSVEVSQKNTREKNTK